MVGSCSQSRTVLPGGMSVSSPATMIILPVRAKFSLAKPGNPVTEEHVVIRATLYPIHLAKEEATRKPKNPRATEIFSGISWITKGPFRNVHTPVQNRSWMLFLSQLALCYVSWFIRCRICCFPWKCSSSKWNTRSYIRWLERHMAWHIATNYI